MMSTCLICVIWDVRSPIGISLWSHRRNHQDGSYPSVEGTHLVSCTTINLTISSHRVTWFVHKCMLRFVFWFKIQSPLGLIIRIYPNQISSANYRYRNIISTHTNGYVMLGLCMKPCATISHYFSTLWIWNIHNAFIGKAVWGEVI